MLNSQIKKQLAQYQSANLVRQRIPIQQRDANQIIIDRLPCINFCSNDYLGLTSHEAVKQAFIAGVTEYGVGSGSAALISGYFHEQQLLEEKFAKLLQRERAIYFNSGYHANLGVMTTFANKSSLILSDKDCHASILDGIQLSKAKHRRYRHCDLNHLRKLLQEKIEDTLIVTESVYSMSGDIAPVDKISFLANEYQAKLIIDDAHGFGILGNRGQGISEHYKLSQTTAPCIVTPLGKAAGSIGAMVSGSNETIEALLQFARTYRYTTALPPAAILASIKALEIIEMENWRRERLFNLINYFISEAKSRKLNLLNEELTPIKSIIVKNNSLALNIQQQLIKIGFFVSCIRPPTVPLNTSRIRISLNCNHQKHEIDQLLNLLVQYIPLDDGELS